MPVDAGTGARWFVQQRILKQLDARRAHASPGRGR
jgi:hypothetical protein